MLSPSAQIFPLIQPWEFAFILFCSGAVSPGLQFAKGLAPAFWVGLVESEKDIYICASHPCSFYHHCGIELSTH